MSSAGFVSSSFSECFESTGARRLGPCWAGWLEESCDQICKGSPLKDHVSWSHDLGHARQVGLNKNIWLVLGRWLVGSTENLKETWTNANNNALRCNVYVDEKDKCKSDTENCKCWGKKKKKVTSTIFRVMEAHWHELAATGYIGLILLLVTSFTGDGRRRWWWYDDDLDDGPHPPSRHLVHNFAIILPAW